MTHALGDSQIIFYLSSPHPRALHTHTHHTHYHNMGGITLPEHERDCRGMGSNQEEVKAPPPLSIFEGGLGDTGLCLARALGRQVKMPDSTKRTLYVFINI